MAVGSSSENLPPRTLARVARELRNLHQSPPEGVRLIIDGDDDDNNDKAGCTLHNHHGSLEQVICEMEGPTGTPYEGRFFVLKLSFSAEFPAAPPQGFFLTKIYHPNVDMSSGAICVNTLKKDWTPQTTLCHVLAVIRCLLIVPFPESSLNDEAGKQFMENYQEYHHRARLLADIHGRKYLDDDSNTNEENKLDTEDKDTNTKKSTQKAAAGDEEGEPEDPSKSSDGVAVSCKKNPLRASSNGNKKILVKKGSSNSGNGSAANNAKLARKKSLKRL